MQEHKVILCVPTSHNVHNALCFERGEMENLWYRMHSKVLFMFAEKIQSLGGYILNC